MFSGVITICAVCVALAFSGWEGDEARTASIETSILTVSGNHSVPPRQCLPPDNGFLTRRQNHGENETRLNFIYGHRFPSRETEYFVHVNTGYRKTHGTADNNNNNKVLYVEGKPFITLLEAEDEWIAYPYDTNPVTFAVEDGADDTPPSPAAIWPADKTPPADDYIVNIAWSYLPFFLFMGFITGVGQNSRTAGFVDFEIVPVNMGFLKGDIRGHGSNKNNLSRQQRRRHRNRGPRTTRGSQH